jgi:hypothetical protein
VARQFPPEHTRILGEWIHIASVDYKERNQNVIYMYVMELYTLMLENSEINRKLVVIHCILKCCPELTVSAFV